MDHPLQESTLHETLRVDYTDTLALLLLLCFCFALLLSVYQDGLESTTKEVRAEKEECQGKSKERSIP